MGLLLLPVLRGVGAGKGRARRPLEGRPQALVGYHNMELACAKVDRHHHPEVDRRASSFELQASGIHPYLREAERAPSPPAVQDAEEQGQGAAAASSCRLVHRGSLGGIAS